ncbi:MAG: MotA/TolQ/ExbB proton channel family protein [Campylobacterales bacterium]|nr:MotA/TolQ/ExbB proton channel family protein [Campylobacterales bacterium]
MKKILSLFIALSIVLFAASETELERAYAKEFAYLKAQKNMLEKRLDEVKKTQEKKLYSLNAELSLLQNVVLKKNAQSEKLEDTLFRTQQNVQSISDDTSLIENVMMQSTSSLKPYGIEVAIDANNYQASLKEVFSRTQKLISTLGSVQSSAGKFYVEDGSEKEGMLVRVGNVATYGVSTDVAGALVPAGDGKLKLWKAAESAESAKALLEGKKTEEIAVFLYENAEKEIEDLREKSVVDVINSGGVIGWVIVVLGLVALALAILRSVFLMSANKSTGNLAKSALEKLLKEGKEGALIFLKTQKGSTARVLKATIRNLDRDREHIEDIVSESVMHESGRLDRFGSVILVIAAVAPLLGLLGTVTGMIATFDIITEFGTGDPKLLSGGISIALVTTELGLIVAIPVLMVGNLLSGWAERIKDSMEHSALHVINEYSKQR